MKPMTSELAVEIAASRQAENNAIPRSSRLGFVRASLRGGGVKRLQPNQETRKRNGHGDAGEKVERGLDSQVKIAYG